MKVTVEVPRSAPVGVTTLVVREDETLVFSHFAPFSGADENDIVRYASAVDEGVYVATGSYALGYAAGNLVRELFRDCERTREAKLEVDIGPREPTLEDDLHAALKRRNGEETELRVFRDTVKAAGSFSSPETLATSVLSVADTAARHKVSCEKVRSIRRAIEERAIEERAIEERDSSSNNNKETA